MVYHDTGDANFSYLYPRDKFDELIVWSKSFKDLAEEQNRFYELYIDSFPQFTRALNLEDAGEVIVGVYHAGDCASNFAGYLGSNGYKTRVDLRLTDELPFLLISHHLRRGMPQQIVREHMREDQRLWELKKHAQDRQGEDILEE